MPGSLAPRAAAARAPMTADPLARSGPADRGPHEACRRPPAALRMMAAMAQQDCGQCGSSCEEYSEPARHQAGRSG